MWIGLIPDGGDLPDLPSMLGGRVKGSQGVQTKLRQGRELGFWENEGDGCVARMGLKTRESDSLQVIGLHAIKEIVQERKWF